ncbi:MAG: DUF523 and DUF1722 domain-containing protein [Pseudomonadota bacterium]|nr:DUF523 and DUF1722 domain-containing protein [Pseudomonadota bacterium]
MESDALPLLPLRIGISSCLLGNPVRFDAGHKYSAYITQTLGEYFEFVPFCPEVAIGLGIPRPPIRLVSVDGSIRVRAVENPEQDVTDALIENGRAVARRLCDVSGYLFKEGSPSCGMERVKVYQAPSGRPLESSAGLFAGTIMRALPELPVEEEGRLMDPRLRENFIERVFIYHRWHCYGASGMTPAALADFHTRHKFNVLAHDEPVYRELGRLVADAGRRDITEAAAEYIRVLMRALAKIATPKQHAKVLMLIMDFFKHDIDSNDKAELLGLIDAYRQEQVPLIVPLTLIHHHLRCHPNDYISSQSYINPHPRELMLRNRI